MGKDPGKSSIHKIINQDEQEVAAGKQNVRAACRNDNLGFKFFFEPWILRTSFLIVIL